MKKRALPWLVWLGLQTEGSQFDSSQVARTSVAGSSPAQALVRVRAGGNQSVCFSHIGISLGLSLSLKINAKISSGEDLKKKKKRSLMSFERESRNMLGGPFSFTLFHNLQLC